MATGVPSPWPVDPHVAAPSQAVAAAFVEACGGHEDPLLTRLSWTEMLIADLHVAIADNDVTDLIEDVTAVLEGLREAAELCRLLRAALAKANGA